MHGSTRLSDTQPIEQQLADAERALAERAFERAHGHCIAVLQSDPTVAHAYYLLAVIAHEHRNTAKALEVLDRGLAQAPGNPLYLAERGKYLLALNRHDEARLAAQACAAENPTDAATQDTLGVLLSRLGDYEHAAPWLEKATAAKSDNPACHYNLAACLQFLGDFERADTHYNRAIVLDPSAWRAYSARSQVKRATDEANHIAELKQCWPDAANDPDASLHIGHALAKEYEDLGDPENAMTWLARGKAAKAASLPQSQVDNAELFGAAARLAADLSIADQPAGDGPLFIVGLPRSGTTLTDRVLSSHSQIHSAGELAHFALALKRATGTPSEYVLDVETLEQASDVDLRTVGDRYLELTEAYRTDAPITLDKMPLNLFYVPAILAALPSARVICLKRHPMDATLSNYRQLFATGFSYYNYAYSLEATARFVAGFEALAARYRDTLPPARYTEVRYEDLVESLESEARRLVDFCDQGWEPACLDFQNNDAPVATASSVQVRQPLYRRALGRWRRYGDALDPARTVFEQAGIPID